MVPTFYQSLDLIPSFTIVHEWSLWFGLCNAYSPQLFSEAHRWSMWFALCNAFSP
ncbi:hypothetical protein Hanom_Chr00s096221g01801411 [Helianthus anomalus]